MAIEGIEPKALWCHFAEVSKIPRNSKNEARAREYVISHAEKNSLEHKTDRAGNVVVYKASKANPDKPVVILQAHLDMVCEKNSCNAHDFKKDPIKIVKDGEWIRADGTTLGADNGIAIAAMLAIIEDPSLAHPPLELFFTIDEETGLTGAVHMEEGLLKGRTIINLDSEEDGILNIGCSGGMETDLHFRIEKKKTPERYTGASIKVAGLKGGHSGTDIHEGRGNAIKLISSLLATLKSEFLLSDISGGTLRNSIPREAQATIAIKKTDLKKLKEHARKVYEKYAVRLKEIEEGLEINVEEVKRPEECIVEDVSSKLIDALNAIPSGIESIDIEKKLMITSTNLGVLKTEDALVKIGTMQRSIHFSAMEDLSQRISAIGRLAGAEISNRSLFPAWQPDYDSNILKICRQCHLELFGYLPEVTVIHAGLECGVIADKIPGIETISFGPTIQHAHSPSERVNIKSVENFWRYLMAVLKEMAK